MPHQSGYEAPPCARCTYGVGALRLWRHAKSTETIVCVECARKPGALEGPHEELRALLKPRGGHIVVLTDGPKKEYGRIILPDSVFGPGGKKLSDVVMAGVVVSVGPGWYARRSLNGAWLAAAPGVGVRKPMAVRLGDRVILIAKHDKAIDWWRGLAITNDNACLSVEEKQSESAAQ